MPFTSYPPEEKEYSKVKDKRTRDTYRDGGWTYRPGFRTLLVPGQGSGVLSVVRTFSVFPTTTTEFCNKFTNETRSDIRTPKDT